MAIKKTSSAKKVPTKSVEETKEENGLEPFMTPSTSEMVVEKELESELLVPTLDPTDIMGMEMVSEDQLLEPDMELTEGMMEASGFQSLPISELESWNQDIESPLMEPGIELEDRTTESLDFQSFPVIELESWNQDIESPLMEPGIELEDMTTETLGFQPLSISKVESWSQDVEALSVSEIVTTVETWFLSVEGSMFDPEGLGSNQ